MSGRPGDSLSVRKAIDGGKIPPVWLWSGPETFLKNELFPRLAIAVVGEDMLELNAARFRGGDDAVDAVLNVCRSLPMLSARRAVWYRDIERLGKSEREQLVEYVAHPVPETALVLSGERGPRDPLHARLAKAGADAAVFWTPFADQTLKWIQIRFRDLGKQCDRASAEHLLAACGGSGGHKVPLADIAPEIEKVALALGSRNELQEADLKVIGRKADEALLYQVVDRVTAGDAPGAIRALDGALLFKQNNGIRLVATLTHRVSLLAKVRDMLDAGMPPAEVKRAARVWPVDAWPLVERGARGRSRAVLGDGLAVLARADRTLKSTSKNQRVVLEGVLLRLCDG